MALGSLGGVYQETGRIEEAERTYEKALAIHREVAHRRGEGNELSNLASLYHETGRMAPAERTYEEALAIHREVGNRSSEGKTLGNLALLCRRHHRAVHEEGYRVERAPDGALRFFRPDGRPLPEVPPLPTITADPVQALRAHHETRCEVV